MRFGVAFLSFVPVLALGGSVAAGPQTLEDVKLLATDGAPDDELGTSVAVWGDRALVGAPIESHAGHQGAGSAYVFERDASGAWNEVFKIKALDGDEYDYFGYAVSLFGDWAAISAPSDDDTDYYKGSAYLFERNAIGKWIQRVKLLASDGPPGQQLGHSIAMWGAGERIIVGGVFADDGGAAYVFERNAPDSWREVAKLQPSDALWFGASVSIHGRRAIVGAKNTNGPGFTAGAAYVFERQPDGTWVQTAKIQPIFIDEGDQFGSAVSLHGDRALIGAYGDSDFVDDGGAVYVFDLDSNGNWIETAKLYPSTLASYDIFGTTVALFGDRAVAGTPWAGTQHGTASVFERAPNGAWSEVAVLKESDPHAYGEFSTSLAISGDRILVGRAEGFLGTPGTAYGYDLGVGQTYCQSTANSTGAPAILAIVGSSSVAANALSLVASPMPEASGIFYLGPLQASVPFGNGTRCVAGSIVRMPFADVESYTMSQRMDLAAPPLAGIVVPGSTWNFQAWFRDPPAGGAYFNTSSAISIVFEP